MLTGSQLIEHLPSIFNVTVFLFGRGEYLYATIIYLKFKSNHDFPVPKMCYVIGEVFRMSERLYAAVKPSYFFFLFLCYRV